MKIIVKVLNGADARFAVTENTTVPELKELVAQHLDIPSSQQRLLYKGKLLQDNSTLKLSGIEAESKITVTVKPGVSVPLQSRTVSQCAQPTSGVVELPADPADGAPIDLSARKNSKFTEELMKLLSKHFRPTDMDKVYEQFMKNWNQKIKYLSLQEIENLASINQQQQMMP